MTTARPAPQAARVPPPSKHQLALMIWLAVFPTLTLLNVLLGDRLSELPTVLRTFVLATLAVRSSSTPSPPLQRARGRLLSRSA
jgi:hypothetical protein